jgi:hypothetical protein
VTSAASGTGGAGGAGGQGGAGGAASACDNSGAQHVPRCVYGCGLSAELPDDEPGGRRRL